MSGGTNNLKKPGGSGAYQPGGQNAGGWMPPQMVTGGGFGPGGQGGGAASPQWGQGGHPQPNPAQMEAWKKQFTNWKQGQGQPGQLGGLLGGGQPGQFPPMNIPGLLAGGQPGLYGSNNPPGFPGYANLPKNWQDEGYSWQDPNNPDATYNIIA